MTWRYSFFNKPSWNAGLTFGARWLQIGAGLKLKSNLANYSSEKSFGIPAVLIGLNGAGCLTPKFLFRFTFEYFQLNVSGISVKVVDNRFSLEYYLYKQFGLGFAYSNIGCRATEVPFSDSFRGDIKFVFSGFSLFLLQGLKTKNIKFPFSTFVFKLLNGNLF